MIPSYRCHSSLQTTLVEACGQGLVVGRVGQEARDNQDRFGRPQASKGELSGVGACRRGTSADWCASERAHAPRRRHLPRFTTVTLLSIHNSAIVPRDFRPCSKVGGSYAGMVDGALVKTGLASSEPMHQGCSTVGQGGRESRDPSWGASRDGIPVDTCKYLRLLALKLHCSVEDSSIQWSETGSL
eukprot:scaffold426_cov319-Pavlova_lutheri.AAC.14